MRVGDQTATADLQLPHRPGHHTVEPAARCRPDGDQLLQPGDGQPTDIDRGERVDRRDEIRTRGTHVRTLPAAEDRNPLSTNGNRCPQIATVPLTNETGAKPLDRSPFS